MESLLWFLANPIEADNDEHKAIFDSPVLGRAQAITSEPITNVY